MENGPHRRGHHVPAQFGGGGGEVSLQQADVPPLDGDDLVLLLPKLKCNLKKYFDNEDFFKKMFSRGPGQACRRRRG